MDPPTRGDPSTPATRFAARAAAIGLAGTVTFLGHRDNPERYYQGADIYLCCSSYEANSLALLEAAASSLPVVTTRVGIASEFVGDADEPSGVVIAREAGAAGEALAMLAAMPTLRARYGSAGRRRAERVSRPGMAR